MVLLCTQTHGIQGGLRMLAGIIGQTEFSPTALFRGHGVTPFRDILTPDCFQRIYPGSGTPKTVLVAEVVFWLMVTVALGDGSMAGGIGAFWAPLRAILPQLPLAPVTEEAFCLARKALPLRFFLLLFADVVERFTGQFAGRFRWKDRRLLGIDGMDVDLPNHPHLRRVFPPPSNQHGAVAHPQGRLVGLVGLWDGLCYAFRWTTLAVGEQPSARRLFQRLTALDLVLADRNFPDLASFAVILSRAADFLFHLPSGRFLKSARTLTLSRRRDEWYAFLPLPKLVAQLHPLLGPVLRVRILQYQRPGFRVSWLITSLLDVREFPYEELVELYHQRWRQETFHREWKYTLQLSNLRSHTAAGLLKEVLVQLILNNLTRWIMAEAAAPSDRPVDLKFLEAKRLILAALPAMVAAPTCLLPQLYRQLLAAIARQRIRVRPGRSYPRKWDARTRPKGHGKFAAPAKLPAIKENSHAPI
jgi:hypothetical protein